mmetsp:Transcript_3009/g.9395  ORF Transcript_3009/g.9395 Transcript_3009/m.9395 type:complete len:382 (-) Transcript_3009:31-1176(-)
MHLVCVRWDLNSLSLDPLGVRKVRCACKHFSDTAKRVQQRTQNGGASSERRTEVCSHTLSVLYAYSLLRDGEVTPKQRPAWFHWPRPRAGRTWSPEALADRYRQVEQTARLGTMLLFFSAEAEPSDPRPEGPVLKDGKPPSRPFKFVFYHKKGGPRGKAGPAACSQSWDAAKKLIAKNFDEIQGATYDAERQHLVAEKAKEKKKAAEEQKEKAEATRRRREEAAARKQDAASSKEKATATAKEKNKDKESSAKNGKQRKCTGKRSRSGQSKDAANTGAAAPSPAPTAVVTRDKPQEFCSCRGPEHGDMIECEGCGEWYHLECLEMTEFPEGEWLCILCTCRETRRSISAQFEQLEQHMKEMQDDMLPPPRRRLRRLSRNQK